MATIAKHIQIGRANGAEAGLKALVQYLNSPLGQANTKVAETRARLQACGNFEAALPLYEELFLSGTEAVADSGDWLSGVETVVVKPKRTRKGKGAITQMANAKPRTWTAFWVAKKGLPTEVGATFVYTSKKYRTTSKHRVESVKKDGSIVTRRISLSR